MRQSRLSQSQGLTPSPSLSNDANQPFFFFVQPRHPKIEGRISTHPTGDFAGHRPRVKRGCRLPYHQPAVIPPTKTPHFLPHPHSPSLLSSLCWTFATTGGMLPCHLPLLGSEVEWMGAELEFKEAQFGQGLARVIDNTIAGLSE